MTKKLWSIDVDVLVNIIAIGLMLCVITFVSFVLGLKLVLINNEISFYNFVAIIVCGYVTKYIGSVITYKFNYTNTVNTKLQHDIETRSLSGVDYTNTIFFTPIIEELIFRNTILQFVCNHTNIFIAVCISSVLHAVAHTKHKSLIIIHIGMGIVFSAIYLYIGLIGCVLYHAFYNFLIVKKLRG